MPTTAGLAPGPTRTQHAAETASSNDAASSGRSDSQTPAVQQPRHVRRSRRKASRHLSGVESSDSEDNSWTRWEGLRHLDTLDGCHEYHISGFSLAQALGPGVRLCSDYFEVADQLWRVEVYPAGVSAEASNHLSLFLTTPGNSAAANQVLHKLVIVDQSGKGHHIVKSKSHVSGSLLASRGIVAAYPKAAKLNHLMAHARHYLLHDTLLIRATVQVVRSWSYAMAPPPLMYHTDPVQDLTYRPYQTDPMQDVQQEGLAVPGAQPSMQQYADPGSQSWR